jgi:hypothetical protein
VQYGIYFSAFGINPGKSADDPEKSGWILQFPIGGTVPPDWNPPTRIGPRGSACDKRPTTNPDVRVTTQGTRNFRPAPAAHKKQIQPFENLTP